MALERGARLSRPLYLGIDLGTQSVRALAVDECGNVLVSASHPLTSHRSGARHEQGPEDWWSATVLCCRSVMQAVGRSAHFAGLAVDATSGTILLVDQGLRPVTPALMYDDARAVAESEAVNAAGAELWRQLSYSMQPSWALPKLCWLLHHCEVPADARLAHQNDFINARLAGHPLATDSSHSLKTGYDLLRSEWPTAIFDRLNLPASIFPSVVPPGQVIGNVSAAIAEETGLPAGLAIFSGMTDGCAAQISAGAVTPGSWNSVLGTTLVIKGVTPELIRDPLGVVYSHRSADGNWLPGGASNTGAGILARDFPNADLDALNRAAASLQPSSTVIYPLAGRGERFPFAAPSAESFTLGTTATREKHYAAVLQGVAFVERLAFDYLRYLGAPTNGRFSFTGGAAKSREWNQLRADILEREIAIPAISEGAFGMAVLVAADKDAITASASRMVRIQETICPGRPFSEYADQYGAFVDELAARGWLPASIAVAALQGVAV